MPLKSDATNSLSTQSVQVPEYPAVSISPDESVFLTELGANLRRIRAQSGLSQEAMAHTIGIHRTYYSAVERGERNLSLLTLRRICNAMSISLHAVLPGNPA